MIASTAVWASEGTSGRSTVTSQLELLESLASQPRVLAMKLDGWGRIPPAALPNMVRIELTRAPSARQTGRDVPPMFVLPPLPAGEYQVHLHDAARGWTMIGVSRDQYALHTTQLPAPPIALRFSLPVRGLVVRGDEDARRVVSGMTLEPVHIASPAERVTDGMARRAVRYGESTAFFLDDRSFPEPDGFWVGGQRDSLIVLQPDAARSTAPIRLRNGAVENLVTLEAGSWRQELPLTPGQEADVDVPLDTARGAAIVRIASRAGFRPSDADSSSRDQRFLGVWVQSVR